MEKNEFKKYRVSDTSTRFIDFLKQRNIKHELTADFLALNIYLYCDSDLLQLGKDFAMNTQSNIKTTVTYKMVSEEARELSMKLQNTVYVVQSGNTLYSTLVKESGVVLSSYNLGNQNS